MGRNKLFHKRKVHRASTLARRFRQIPQKPRYLIVCEGAATEPHYFKGLKNHERLPTAHIKICGEECGSDPMSVVNYALQVYAEEHEDRFDRIFCVIDRDEHANFNAVVARVTELAATGTPIELIVSWPCFEFWVLLHHNFTRSAFCSKRRGRSGCDAVSSEIRRKHDKTYTKGHPGIYARLKPSQGIALRNAHRASVDAKATQEFNPSTDVHTLVTALLALAA